MFPWFEAAIILALPVVVPRRHYGVVDLLQASLDGSLPSVRAKMKFNRKRKLRHEIVIERTGRKSNSI
jgi:hypothetical protein